jgi:3-deoxy-D-manno-octulosonic-acid transferase
MGLLRPQKLVLIEGEIWPNLMAACVERGVPVMLANARLSTRSERRFAKFKSWTAPFFQLLSWIGIPDERDRRRWESIGVSKDRIHLTGSIKFDHSNNHLSGRERFEDILGMSGFDAHTPFLIAGSTHDGEEAILVESFKRWRKKHSALRMLIAPRHVERVPEIVRELAPKGVKIILRTALPSCEPWDVLLLDTTGELREWYRMATVAFIGKSLTALGGQNPVEPALFAKPVVFGPHMENFESVVDLLLSYDGALQAHSETHMEELVDALLSNSERRRQLGKNAQSALTVHQGAAKKTADLVLETPGARIES